MSSLHYAVSFCHLKLHFYVFFTLVCFEPPQVNIGDDTIEKHLDQILAIATICRQHLTNKIPVKWLTQEQWREYNKVTNCSIWVKPFKSVDEKVCNIEVQLTTAANWITASIPFCLISRIIQAR